MILNSLLNILIVFFYFDIIDFFFLLTHSRGCIFNKEWEKGGTAEAVLVLYFSMTSLKKNRSCLLRYSVQGKLSQSLAWKSTGYLQWQTHLSSTTSASTARRLTAPTPGGLCSGSHCPPQRALASFFQSYLDFQKIGFSPHPSMQLNCPSSPGLVLRARMGVSEVIFHMVSAL